MKSIIIVLCIILITKLSTFALQGNMWYTQLHALRGKISKNVRF